MAKSFALWVLYWIFAGIIFPKIEATISQNQTDLGLGDQNSGNEKKADLLHFLCYNQMHQF